MHDSLPPARRRWKCRITFGFPMRNGLGLNTLLPTETRGHGARMIDRLVSERKRKCPEEWRALAQTVRREVYRPKKTLYQDRFVRWAERGMLGTDIQQAGGMRRRLRLERLFIDSNLRRTKERSHAPMASDEARPWPDRIGRTKGGLGRRKLHAVCDATGRFQIHAA